MARVGGSTTALVAGPLQNVLLGDCGWVVDGIGELGRHCEADLEDPLDGLGRVTVARAQRGGSKCVMLGRCCCSRLGYARGGRLDSDAMPPGCRHERVHALMGERWRGIKGVLPYIL